MRLKRLTFARGVILAVTIAVCVATGALFSQRALKTGLVGHYFDNADWRGVPAVVVVENEISTRTVATRASRSFRNRAFSAVWRGLLWVDRAGVHTFTLSSDEGSWLFLDDRLVIADGGRRGVPSAAYVAYLEAGPHPLEIRYFDTGVRRALELRWAYESERLRAIEGTHLFPSRVAYQAHRWLPPSGFLIPLLLSGVLIGLIVSGGVRLLTHHLRLHEESWSVNAALVGVLTLSSSLLLPGIWWGIPSFRGWAPDEIIPARALTALQAGFSGGWNTVYPPLQYYVLTVVTLPFEAMTRVGLTDMTNPDTYFTAFVLMRLLSVVMGVATVYLTYRCGMELHQDRMAGILAALLLTTTPPFVYYGKTANVDVPYLFWFVLSLLNYIRFVSHSRPAHLVSFAVRSGPRKLDSGLSEISIVFQAAVPRPVAPKYTTSGVRRPSELCRRRPL